LLAGRRRNAVNKVFDSWIASSVDHPSSHAARVPGTAREIGLFFSIILTKYKYVLQAFIPNPCSADRGHATPLGGYVRVVLAMNIVRRARSVAIHERPTLLRLTFIPQRDDTFAAAPAVGRCRSPQPNIGTAQRRCPCADRLPGPDHRRFLMANSVPHLRQQVLSDLDQLLGGERIDVVSFVRQDANVVDVGSSRSSYGWHGSSGGR
jgi:hypothetical protein